MLRQIERREWRFRIVLAGCSAALVALFLIPLSWTCSYLIRNPLLGPSLGWSDGWFYCATSSLCERYPAWELPPVDSSEHDGRWVEISVLDQLVKSYSIPTPMLDTVVTREAGFCSRWLAFYEADLSPGFAGGGTAWALLIHPIVCVAVACLGILPLLTTMLRHTRRNRRRRTGRCACCGYSLV